MHSIRSAGQAENKAVLGLRNGSLVQYKNIHPLIIFRGFGSSFASSLSGAVRAGRGNKPSNLLSGCLSSTIMSLPSPISVGDAIALSNIAWNIAKEFAPGAKNA